MDKRGILFVVSGPSGVGKDSILDRFMPGRQDVRLSISSTTRTPRAGEVDGRDYNFISREEFEYLINSGQMLEYAEYAGNYYGTPKKWVDDNLSNGMSVILEIELVGALKVRALLPQAVFIFLMPPSLEALRDRLIGRGTETPESVVLRLEAAKREILQASAYDYIIVNQTIPESCEKLSAVIMAATQQAAHQKEIIREVIGHA